MPTDQETFECTVFHLTMPRERQQEWCAKKQRTARDGDYCGICPTGVEAARNTRDAVQAQATGKVPGLLEGIGARLKKGKERDMPTAKEKKTLQCKTHGEYKGYRSDSPCPQCKAAGKGKKQTGRQGPARKKPAAAHGDDCPGCQALQLQLNDLTRAENVMVAAGLATKEQFDKARMIVRDLAKEQ